MSAAASAYRARRRMKRARRVVVLVGPMAPFFLIGLALLALLVAGAMFMPGLSGGGGDGQIKEGTVPAEYVPLYEAAGKTCPTITPVLLALLALLVAGAMFMPGLSGGGGDGQIKEAPSPDDSDPNRVRT